MGGEGGVALPTGTDVSLCCSGGGKTDDVNYLASTFINSWQDSLLPTSTCLGFSPPPLPSSSGTSPPPPRCSCGFCCAADSILPCRSRLTWTLLHGFGGRFALTGFLILCSRVFYFAMPFVLSYLVAFLNDKGDERESVWVGFAVLAAMLFCGLMQTLFQNQAFTTGYPSSCLAFAFAFLSLCSALRVPCHTYTGLLRFLFRFRLGGQLRAAVMTAVYAKTLRTSSSARAFLSTGQTINLMSSDANRLFNLVRRRLAHSQSHHT